MNKLSNRTPKIVELAGRLEQDIRDKMLSPGDPYFSTQEAASMLGVSTVSANRALQLLVKRELLHRRQRKGTFIAEPANNNVMTTTVDRVHMLVHQNFLKTEGLLADGVIIGIQEKLPQADIQFNFLPANDEGEYAKRVISEVLRSARSEGFVLVRAPLEVQRTVQHSGLPAVIHGTPFPSINQVPWIERDHYQSGRIAAERLIRSGFRTLTVITREKPMPGDHRMLQGVRDEMAAQQMSIGDISWQALPSDTEVARHAVLELLRSGKSGQGFICRSRPQADGAAEAIDAEGLKLGRGAGIVLLDVYQTSSRESPPFPYILATMEPETIGQHIGQMLWLQAQSVKPDPDQEIIPVELKEPISE